MSISKIIKYCFLFLIFFILITPNSHLIEVTKSNTKIQVSKNKHSVQNEFRYAVKSSNLISYQQQFDYTEIWNTSSILNKSQSLNPSTRLVINNTTVEFAPENSSHTILLTVGTGSQIEILNSTLYLNNTNGGACSIEIEGSKVSIINSTLIGLGNGGANPGFLVETSQITIENSNFESGFIGLRLINTPLAYIKDSSFKNFNQSQGMGILARDSNNISLINCTFDNIETGIELSGNSQNVSMEASQFVNCTYLCLDIFPAQYYFEISNVFLKRNIFQDSGFGLSIIGENIEIINNTFENLAESGSFIGGRHFLIENNSYRHLNNGITTVENLPNPDETWWWIASISNLTIQHNVFEFIDEYSICISNYEFPTLFHIDYNSFFSIRTGIYFQGRLGGESSTNRSWVIGNTFNNSSYTIIGDSIGIDYVGRFKYTTFSLNAFINCSEGYTRFQEENYYLEDIRWDDDFFGNYWDEFIENNPKDEDNNQIGDSFYIVSSQYAQVDEAPLLSLDLISQKTLIGSTHPADIVRTKSELRVNNTLIWMVKTSSVDISVYINDQEITYEQDESNITVSLATLKAGTHNFSLVLEGGGRIYTDLVWVNILADESNLEEVIILIGALSFGAIVIAASIFYIKKRK
ncbi:MAG: hypothetical protein ACFE95_10895 [Candidatus Hodarchaeota archaeon]